MVHYAFNEQGLAFLECQENSITRNELLECFESCPVQLTETPSWHNSRTSSGRLLQVYYRYVSHTDEILILTAVETKTKKSAAPQ